MITTNRVRDWGREYLQTILLIAVIVINLRFNIPEFINRVTTDASVPVSDLPVEWRFAIGSGRWILLIVVFVIVFLFVRRSNKEFVLKQSVSDAIIWHPYVGYAYCRYVLNIKQISLTRVPIPMQFKLIWENLFVSYECLEGVTEKEKGTDNIELGQFNNEPYTSTINLVLADTYPLDWKSKLPASTLNLTTIVIDRKGEKGVRYYSKDFVAKIATTIHELPSYVTTINLFATINAAHCYHITKEVFMTGGRDNIKHLFVYEQTKGSWVFEGKRIKVF